MNCFFVSDLHGREPLYDRLFALVAAERPAAVFCGGDLLPGGFGLADDGGASTGGGFIESCLVPGLVRLRRELGDAYPRVFLIFGNDDPRCAERLLAPAIGAGLVDYVHGARADLAGFDVYGYACVPPTPFPWKDWERYDVATCAGEGCLSPEDGFRSVPVDASDIRRATIASELETLTAGADLSRAIVLFHAPPHGSVLDRAGFDLRPTRPAQAEVHVGSLAVRRFIEGRQPLVTLHGHIHESARLSGSWRERIGRTWALGAAHGGPELCVVRFDPGCPDRATRELL